MTSKVKVQNDSSKAKKFQKYFNQIPQTQQKSDVSRLSNYKCYANAHGEK